MKAKPKQTTPQDTYHAQALLGLLANKWTIHVVYALRHETKRYGEISKVVPGATQKVLTGTLRKLERSGFVTRTTYPTVPPKVDYKLTELGLELLAMIETVTNWAKNYEEKIRQAQKAYDRQNN